jgi:hypothetical protein
MQKRIVSFLAVCAVVFFASNAFAQYCCFTFVSNLSPANEVPPLDTGMGGLGVTVVTDNGDGTSTALVIVSAFNNDTPITASHIHIGDATVAGPVICPLAGPEFTNPVIGTCNFNATQTAALYNGGLYLNVHTQTNPSGEIRDQLNFVQ